MKEIQLTQGQVALVDDEDFERVSQRKWCAMRRRTYAQTDVFWAMTRIGQEIVSMHAFLLGNRQGYVIDHLDGQPLNNCRGNLRHATKSQNGSKNLSTLQRHNTSGVRGVVRHRRRWLARIRVNGRLIHIGYFTDKLEAAKAYNAAAIKYHGEFATLNPIEGEE